MQLSHARAVVTGGASGLGLATARHIVDAGGRVALLDLDSDRGEAAAAKLGAQALFIHVDVTREESVDAAFRSAADALQGLTFCVCCAGVAPVGRVLARDGLMDTADFARTVQVNLVGTFSAVRAAVFHMQHNTPNADGERGVVVTTSSIAAFEGQLGQAPYAASKGGVAALTLPLAREFAWLGVRVVSIAPGLFHTPLFQGLPQEAMQMLKDNIPFPKRLGEPHEFAELAAHIYTNAMLNGAVLRLDGALRMPPK
jgi:NAD(P)-dependent dehydrogenase (short-subunit alcohol dehydrogenase family)